MGRVVPLGRFAWQIACRRVDEGDAVREMVLDMMREKYRHFGPTLAAEKLADRDGVKVSRGDAAALDGRGRIVAAAEGASVFPLIPPAPRGPWRTHQDRRVGPSPVRGWRAVLRVAGVHSLPGRALRGTVPREDDATGRLMALRFVRSERRSPTTPPVEGCLV